ncbi:MAG TPA: S8 family serine peptidase [Chitinophagaceae bacterium]|nr:S8 family serine peptidase [Chitinophagaceae bacterium]
MKISRLFSPITKLFKRRKRKGKAAKKAFGRKSAIKDFLPNIVVKFNDNISFPYQEDSDVREYLSTNKMFPWQQLHEKFPDIRIGKLFNSVKPEEIKTMVEEIKKSNPGYQPPNFLACASIEYPVSDYGKDLLAAIVDSKIVDYAYIESDASPSFNVDGSNPALPEQGYLNRAPQGINAKYAWGKDGGKGESTVQFIDIEQGWALNHTDLPGNIPLLYGVNSEFLSHGAAVLGVIFMQDNGEGGVGIAHRASPQLISQIVERTDSNGRVRKANIVNDAIMKAISQLHFGDVLLIESQVHDEDFRIWPVETRRMTFDLIELATKKGIIVIEPAGNGDDSTSPDGNNLDEYKNALENKILDRTSGNNDFKDSGAIMVAAASDQEEHSKLRSSNFGNRIDCFAWGKNVYTADDPAILNDSSRPDPDKPYWNFSGTSSAAAIIAGAAIVVQSIVEASDRPRLNPAQMREILSKNGTSSERIGVMPDLKKIIDEVLPSL